jgi:hypothetical protein
MTRDNTWRITKLNLRPVVHQGNWKLQLSFNYSHFSVESQSLLECMYTEEADSVIVRSWGPTQTWTTHRGWRWDASVLVLNSLTNIYMSKELFARVASRQSRFLTTGEAGLVSVTQLVVREQTFTKFKTSENSLLWQAIAVFHPKEVGPTLIEFKQKLAYVTAWQRNPNRLVWPRKLKTANQGKIILT